MVEGQPDEALHVQVELRAEPAAGGGLDDADLFVGQPQNGHDVLVVVVGVLGRGIDDQGAVAVDEPGSGIGLDVIVLDERRPVGLLDDALAAGEGRLGIPPADGPRRHDVALGVHPGGVLGHGLLRVEHRRQIPVDDLDGLQRPFGGRFGFGRHQRNRIADAAHLVDGQDRLVFDDDASQVFPGDVVGGEYRHHPFQRPRLFHSDAHDFGMRAIAAERLEGQRSDQFDVRAEQGCAGDFFPGADAGDAPADAVECVRHVLTSGASMRTNSPWMAASL